MVCSIASMFLFKKAYFESYDMIIEALRNEVKTNQKKFALKWLKIFATF